MTTQSHPFTRTHYVDKPGTVGAVWWNQSIKESANVDTRRGMIFAALAGTVIVAGAAAMVFAAASDDDDGEPLKEEPRKSIELQQNYGWNFGAPGESLVYDGTNLKPFDRASLGRLADELAPAQVRLQPWYSSTLFKSPEAMPKMKLGPGSPAVPPIADALKTGQTPAMEGAYAIGQTLAELLSHSSEPVALVIDLAGPEAVALAAGAIGTFEPVFAFDNWPHPRGVVAAHKTLAASVYYQPLFAKKLGRSSNNQPAFVLDRERLATYVDDTRQFDNRWLAKLPSAAQLSALGAKRVLYVVPSAKEPPDLDDLNDVFTEWQKTLEVRAIATDAFWATADGKRPYAGGNPPDGFWAHYDWRKAQVPFNSSNSPSTKLKDWKPTARPILFASASSGASGAGGSAPAGRRSIGMVPVLIGVTTGAVAGAKLAGYRSGSILRSSGGWGG